MKGSALRLRALILLPCVIGVLHCSKGASTPRDCYPLAVGTRWTYDVSAQWLDAGIIKRTHFVSDVTVLEEIDRGAVTGYVLRGDPLHQNHLESGDSPADYAIVKAGSGSYYQVGAEAIKRLRDRRDPLVGLVDSSDVILQCPLIVGARFGETDQMAREDGYYTWGVKERKSERVSGVKGLWSLFRTDTFTLELYTLPDETTAVFVPGVGFTRYHYVHHGSTDEKESRLVELSTRSNKRNGA